jgi:hypothetical protein
VQQDRYCRNCGQELQSEDQFCANCGRPVHATARVPTPEATVPVPPPPQQAQDSSGPPQAPQMQTAPRGPVWGILAVFLVQGIGETIQGIPATSTRDLGFRIGVGMGHSIVITLIDAALILLIGGVYYVYVTARKGGTTFREAVFNWPLVILAAILAFSNLR